MGNWHGTIKPRWVLPDILILYRYQWADEPALGGNRNELYSIVEMKSCPSASGIERYLSVHNYFVRFLII
jgi:hypothetical protein